MSANFAGDILDRNCCFMNFGAYACNTAHFPNGSQNSAFCHIVHTVGSHRARHSAIADHADIAKQRFCLSKLFISQYLLKLFLEISRYYAGSFKPCCFSHYNGISHLYVFRRSRATPKTPADCRRHDYRLIYRRGDLRMASDDFHIAGSRCICSLSHDGLHIIFRASFRQHNRQKYSHRLHAVRSYIVAGDMNCKAPYIAYCRRDRIRRKHTFVLPEVNYSAVLSHTGTDQHLRSLEAYPVNYFIF